MLTMESRVDQLIQNKKYLYANSGSHTRRKSPTRKYGEPHYF